MTDQQPEPTTEAAWAALWADLFGPDAPPESWSSIFARHRPIIQAAIEAEARAEPIDAPLLYAATEAARAELTEAVLRAQKAGYDEGRADERERLARAVPLLRHAAEYLSGELTGKAEPNVLADRLQKLAAIEAEARADPLGPCGPAYERGRADERERLAEAVQRDQANTDIDLRDLLRHTYFLLQPDTASAEDPR